ncbi:unnamed protein product, partial [Gulo gulo]
MHETERRPPPTPSQHDFPHSPFWSRGTWPKGADLLPVQLSWLPFSRALKLRRERAFNKSC